MSSTGSSNTREAYFLWGNFEANRKAPRLDIPLFMFSSDVGKPTRPKLFIQRIHAHRICGFDDFPVKHEDPRLFSFWSFDEGRTRVMSNNPKCHRPRWVGDPAVYADRAAAGELVVSDSIDERRRELKRRLRANQASYPSIFGLEVARLVEDDELETYFFRRVISDLYKVGRENVENWIKHGIYSRKTIGHNIVSQAVLEAEVEAASLKQKPSDAIGLQSPDAKEMHLITPRFRAWLMGSGTGSSSIRLPGNQTYDFPMEHAEAFVRADALSGRYWMLLCTPAEVQLVWQFLDVTRNSAALTSIVLLTSDVDLALKQIGFSEAKFVSTEILSLNGVQPTVLREWMSYSIPVRRLITLGVLERVDE